MVRQFNSTSTGSSFRFPQDINELGRLLTLLRGGLAPDQELLRAGYAELDRDGNGVVSFEELFCWSPRAGR